MDPKKWASIARIVRFMLGSAGTLHMGDEHYLTEMIKLGMIVLRITRLEPWDEVNEGQPKGEVTLEPKFTPHYRKLVDLGPKYDKLQQLALILGTARINEAGLSEAQALQVKKLLKNAHIPIGDFLGIERTGEGWVITTMKGTLLAAASLKTSRRAR